MKVVKLFWIILPIMYDNITAHSNFILTGSFRGLGNRLRVLTTYMMIAAELYNSSNLFCKWIIWKNCFLILLLVTWDINIECPGHFLEIFQPLENVTFVDPNQFDVLQSFATYARSPHVTSNKNTIEILKYHNLSHGPQELHTMKRNYYQHLKPTYFIDEISKRFAADYNICNLSAMHIRLTDLKRVLEDAHLNYSKTEDFYEFVESRPINEKIFLMTDNRETQLHFLTKYPNRIIIYNIITEEESKSCLQHELRCTSLAQMGVELYIAAHAKAFIGSKLSTISETVRYISPNVRAQNCINIVGR